MSKSVELHRGRASPTLSFYTIVTSDTLYNLLKEGKEVVDDNGEKIRGIVEAEGHLFKGRSIVPNNASAIKQEIKKVIEDLKPDIIITTGGTGLSDRDVTIEAVEELFEKRIPGFGELLRLLSYGEIGSAAMLTRATAGVYKKTVIFSIPGSPHAVELALRKLILPEARHIVAHVRG
ncbi:MAG: MogA/MoaB family molybdenum cofactor biosynthesis protein [Candidatus Verstraetearchaeota archaeon]|nr:MogA/MoaB family molybdenum cofactor biosynthesis protein [Candidatus Verstraetearchaeota archaeon]